MQVVIDIDETIFKRARYEYYGENEVNHSLVNEILISVINGTILPKGHGRLIDISEYEKYFNTEITYDDGNHIYSVYANTISTIVEADKEGDIYAD